jgi:hypothetical protein
MRIFHYQPQAQNAVVSQPFGSPRTSLIQPQVALPRSQLKCDLDIKVDILPRSPHRDRHMVQPALRDSTPAHCPGTCAAEALQCLTSSPVHIFNQTT